MKIDPILGPAVPELGWVPAPRYLMRRARIRQLMSKMQPGRLLEIGPGAAALLVELSRNGFRCEALELSVEARTLSQSVVDRFGRDIPLHALPGAQWQNCFDVLCAFDVLEHIEDDQQALAQWVSWIKPGGQLLLSVPAHMKLWRAGDQWAGHFRRYERESLITLLQDAGLEVEIFECYGFPLTNLTEWISAPIYARRIYNNSHNDETNRKQNNDRSGTDRVPHMRLYPLLRSVPGKWALRLFAMIQGIFINKDLGSGYVVRARRQC
ncbi:2-polyprenyl-3-methyl-5-hydroxy-6-metoxy-1,4-benzoquinol methylase [Collimonas sp. OK242]|uniref:class I SAM-dependent methyltransferase n=1 Tax=Collimonas sp. OK242 TaxID=1798195 RepID=UPI00089CE811|nr:class I SAM-dependent methyltransferase [Collimonas sp. OK242]SDX50140.1 2-polyprenyl-3-methyl-5-hydroxy-6-metoxy-1,4-benzoquinol methylase [Collimonas sp. OK242]